MPSNSKRTKILAILPTLVIGICLNAWPEPVSKSAEPIQYRFPPEIAPVPAFVVNRSINLEGLIRAERRRRVVNRTLEIAALLAAVLAIGYIRKRQRP